MSIVALEDLERWGKGSTNPFDNVSLEIPSSSEGNSKFPFDKALNDKIVLWKGSPVLLCVDAISHPSNESLTDRSGLSGVLHGIAGPELHAECMALEGCRTGEAKLTKGYRLPCKFVIHTVGPRYNTKYKTAAENALHSCYRGTLTVAKESGLHSVALPCLYTERKGYPRDEACHVAVRTVRRFLEKHGDSLHTVVFVVETEADLKIYEEVLPLYFPRSKAEEDYAIVHLPADTGNEIGEAVTEERKIKISAGPAGKVATTVPVLSKAKEASPFLEMRDDPDKDRAREKKAEVKEAAVDTIETEYQTLLKEAKSADLSEIEKRGIIRQTGTDSLGRPVIVFVAKNLPKKKELEENKSTSMQAVLLYVIKVLDAVVEKDYVMIYVHTLMERDNQPDYQWLKKVYGLFGRKYKKNLKALYIVHPSFWLKMIFWFLTPFISPKFWKKLTYINRVYDLFDKVERRQVEIPHEVFEYDASINGTTYYQGTGL